MALTPMVLTARLEKKKDPDCRIAFIGPCAAKKLEASRRTIRSHVDFVLTFSPQSTQNGGGIHSYPKLAKLANRGGFHSHLWPAKLAK